MVVKPKVDKPDMGRKERFAPEKSVHELLLHLNQIYFWNLISFIEFNMKKDFVELLKRFLGKY